MGTRGVTRGVCGFRINEKDYLTYNHWDSYPSGLGVEIARMLKDINWNNIKSPEITLVDEDIPPTQEQIEECKMFHNSSVSSGQLTEWYSLLRSAQGATGLKAILDGKLKYMIDSSSFIEDSLFCEWGYIINLDDMVLEIYKGFQTKKPVLSRYKDGNGGNGYFPCELIMEIDIADEEIVEKVKGARDD